MYSPGRRFILAVVLAAAGGLSVGCDRMPSPTSAPASAAGSQCPKHGLAMAQCPFCNAAIIKEQGECVEHGVPEALCALCRPYLVKAFKVENDWCAEHDTPESQCVICNPSIVKKTPPPSGPRTVELVSADEDAPRSTRRPSVTCKNHTMRIRFTSTEIARQAGLEFATVEKRQLSASILCNAAIAYDGNHYARVTPRAPGVVREVGKDLGDVVRAGEVLAVVESAELASATSAFVQASARLNLWEKNHERTHDLVRQGISAAKEDLEAEAHLEESKAAVATARQKARSLGLKDDEIKAITQDGPTEGLLAMRAPFDGVVVERTAVVGEAVDTMHPLFAVADTSRMWALLDVYENDLSLIRLGQPLVLTVGGIRGETFAGTITWISTQLDARTRTLKARALIENPEGRLRANMFGQAVVRVREGAECVVIPKNSVQWDGCCNLVFVRQSDQLFMPRKLRLGYVTEDSYEVLEGIEPGETIVTQGSFLLKTELLKGHIGAGCCEAGEKKS